MSDIININRETKAVNEDGKILERFFAWMVSVTDSLNLLLTNTGSGSPEGSLSAPVGSWYVDTSAAPGTGMYFKETGTGNTGWILRS